MHRKKVGSFTEIEALILKWIVWRANARLLTVSWIPVEPRKYFVKHIWDFESWVVVAVATMVVAESRPRDWRSLSIDVGLALPALAWSRKWTEKTNLVLGNVQKSHLNGWCYEIRKFFSLTGLIVWFSSSFSKTTGSFVGIEAIRSTRLRDFLVFTPFPFIDKEIDSLFHFFSALLL